MIATRKCYRATKRLARYKKCPQGSFGTINSWLFYQLGGSTSRHDGAAKVGGLFIADVTNASRWLFMDPKKIQWDQDLVDQNFYRTDVSFPLSSLLEIESSSNTYGKFEKGFGAEELEGVKVASILGHQHTSFFGKSAYLHEN